MVKGVRLLYSYALILALTIATPYWGKEKQKKYKVPCMERI